MKSLRSTRGSSALEFILLGIPLIFVLISTFEMSRGMWLYHTLAYAIKDGARYAVVHGQSCTIPPNACEVTISKIASQIQSSGSGLEDDKLTLTFTPSSGSAITCLLRDCIDNYATTSWPSGAANAPGDVVNISGVYPFNSAMAMFWPGTSPTMGSPTVVNLQADARESIQY